MAVVGVDVRKVVDNCAEWFGGVAYTPGTKNCAKRYLDTAYTEYTEYRVQPFFCPKTVDREVKSAVGGGRVGCSETNQGRRAAILELESGRHARLCFAAHGVSRDSRGEVVGHKVDPREAVRCQHEGPNFM